METQLSTLIRRHMKRHGLSRSDLVKELGYINVAKGYRRLTQWLTEPTSLSKDQKAQLAHALQLSVETITDAADTDHRVWKATVKRFEIFAVGRPSSRFEWGDK